jgi:hypothetical protein
MKKREKIKKLPVPEYADADLLNKINELINEVNSVRAELEEIRATVDAFVS